jgi:DNA-binding MarR family transcriptional regulator
MDRRTDLYEAYRLLVADVYELAGLSRRTSDDLAAEIGQTTARWHVMSVLLDGPRTVPEIAERLGLTRQSVQRVVDDLVAAGSVTIEDNPAHRRSHLIDLTRAGARAVDRLVERASVDRGAELRDGGVTIDELVAARATVAKVVAALRAADG